MDSSAELSTETVSHHLQPPERSSAQRDSDMESGNENDLPPAIKKPSMDSTAEMLIETVSHHLQPPDRPSAQKDSDMESDNENDMPSAIEQSSMDSYRQKLSVIICSLLTGLRLKRTLT
ncbi:hypothetical protein DPMN_100859 [Dreissena polymorpha]|uniref:Uncharacterized protein n=1 Tax=Dreissena polymorpha TaxID=45954 RepID=A0A9D4R7T6_DREPO|nr:hypothetical protein DPMN_100859 [Dreissena polymorpha]